MPVASALRRTGLTFALGALGGTLFYAIGLPASWLAGAMIFVAAAALARVPVDLPDRMRDGFFVILGLSMGGGVRPDVIDRVAQWPATMALLAVTLVLVTAATYVFLFRFARWDRESAFLGAIPGALSFVMAIAAERRADQARIAASQTVRLVILVSVLPLVITSTASHGQQPAVPEAFPGWADGAVLLVACLAASLLAVRLRVPGGWLTGAFFMSSAINVTGLMPVALPQWILVPCYIGLGCFIGSRFSSTTFSLFLGMLKASLGAIVVGLCVSLAVAWIASVLLGLPFGQLLLAYAPGGLEVMTLLSFMLNLDPAFVAAHQLARYISMVLLLPFITGLLLGRRPNESRTGRN
ncbi:AbrB family transcriptional regulator [Labrenzia aggregata]|uniref:AbrB family transcriptional regulator n=2 Tax=Roseibium aggregatum TaxID=187304 RepID=A0A926P447_9HYPH|nr:AbrB family transcriptional regulator [Roseibium aggregatum]